MKKLMVLSFVAVMALGFTSCKKCKDCTAVVKDDQGNTLGSSTTTELCGDDLKAVDGKTETSTAGGITITTTYDCK